MDPTYHGLTPRVPYRQRTGLFSFSRRTLIMIVVVIVALIVGGILLSNSGDKSGPLQQRLTARLATFQKIVAEGTQNIKDPDLADFNARLNIQLASDTASITSATQKLGTKAAPKEVQTAEADTASFANLSDAELNSHFDDTYRTLISQKLDSTTALIQETYNSTHSKSLRDALKSAYTNFKQLETQLSTTKAQ